MMKRISCFLIFLFVSISFGQNRVRYNDQDLFLSGANLAWVNFANDIGSGNTNLQEFENILLQIHEHGGNSLRWWLHTDGSTSPEFDSTDFVIGPGQYSISDMRKVLDLAWEREVGLKLCLWSFNMLEKSRTNLLDRNTLLLTDTTYTNSYIQNALIPMVDSLKGHPAIIAWEIFNEPEGMSDEFGWSHVQHIPMSYIQRFINLTSAAIHKTDTTAQVTNGCWSIQAMTDVPTTSLQKVAQFSVSEKAEITNRINSHYSSNLSEEQIFDHLEKISRAANYNYYSDARLIEAGGDSAGILDFYSVHYYDWAGTALSPFHNANSFWQLDKQLVVGEFHMKNTLGVAKENLYTNLIDNGYAGAMAWSWTDNKVTQTADILAGVQSLWDNYESDVDVEGIGGDWPTVSILNPVDGNEFSDTSAVNIEIEANDTDGSIVLIEIFVNDTLKIGELTETPYNFSWTDVEPGNYNITAIVKDNDGHSRKSNLVRIIYGSPPFTRLEAENAVIIGTGITVKNDVSSSSGKYVNMAAQVGSVTWNFTNYLGAGNYQIAFGAKLTYDNPKTQYIIVNGDTAAALEFVGGINEWIEKSLFVDLLEGENTIELALFWGWMDLDYLAVPSELVTSIEDENNELPNKYTLEQNYPNPFNPTTTIKYSIPKLASNISGGTSNFSQRNVTLIVYDVLGRRVRTLVNETQSPGNYEVELDASNLSSGIYFYSLETKNTYLRKKMILLK